MGLYENSQNIFIETATPEQFEKIEIGDWLEGYGDVMSHAEKTYLRRLGSLLLGYKTAAIDDPQWDATDAAHPAWWRGETYGAHKAAELITNILSGKETGKGAVNEPVQTMRQKVLDLKAERDRLQRIQENCFSMLNIYKPDISGGSNLVWQVERLCLKLQAEMSISETSFKKIDELGAEMERLKKRDKMLMFLLAVMVAYVKLKNEKMKELKSIIDEGCWQ